MGRLLFLLIAGLLLACHNDEKRAGLWLSFDDRSINQWYELRDLLRTDNVYVTFFITQPDSLTKEEVDKLLKLQQDGHEIGFHGSQHVLSEYYIKENSYTEYLKDEIESGLNTMEKLGFECTSFAYPYGAKYWFTDLILFQKFDILRGVAPLNKEKDISKIDEVYYSFNGDCTLFSFGFDNNSGVTDDMLEKAMDRAAGRNEVLMLYAHAPVSSDKKGYVFNLKTLKFIISKAKASDLEFYTSKNLR